MTPEIATTKAHHVITCGRYRCQIPVCPCERTPCVGSGRWRGKCALSGNKGKDGVDHNRGHCHGWSGVLDAMHVEHVAILAAEVAKTYARKGKPTEPRIETARGSAYVVASYLPLPGEEVVTVHTDVTRDPEERHSVRCDSPRCREPWELGAWRSAALAQGHAERHRLWHAALRSDPGAIEPSSLALTVTPRDVEVGDWHHTPLGGWRRIAHLRPQRQTHGHGGYAQILVLDAGHLAIAEWDSRCQYLVWRGGSPPAWEPERDATLRAFVPKSQRPPAPLARPYVPGGATVAPLKDWCAAAGVDPDEFEAQLAIARAERKSEKR